MSNPIGQLRGKALWAALATLVDSEGAIFIVCAGTDYTTKIQVGSTCADWMQAWQSRIGRGRFVPGEQAPGCKRVYRWVIQKKTDVVYILKRISPYLFVKREQAELAIYFIEKKGSYLERRGLPRAGKKVPTQELAWREEIRNRMRNLNAKGNPERLYVEPPQAVGDDIVRAVESSTELDANALAQ